MSNLLPIAFLAAGLIALPATAHAGHQCFVDYVEPASDGVNVYMQPYIYERGPSLVVIPPPNDQTNPHYLFSYNAKDFVKVDGKWVHQNPPRFIHMGLGEKAYVDANIHSGCEMTVETRNHQTVLHLIGGTSLPNIPSWRFDEIIVAVPYHSVPGAP